MNLSNERIPLPLRDELLADAMPPADLWSRIESAHRVRRTRRRNRRTIGTTLTCALAALCALGYQQVRTPREHIDWQARTEALELQLHSLQREAQVGTNGTGEVEVELSDIDHSLQTAYETGATPKDLAALWKRRSELLDTLIVARKQNLLLTRI